MFTLKKKHVLDCHSTFCSTFWRELIATDFRASFTASWSIQRTRRRKPYFFLNSWPKTGEYLKCNNFNPNVLARSSEALNFAAEASPKILQYSPTLCTVAPTRLEPRPTLGYRLSSGPNFWCHSLLPLLCFTRLGLGERSYSSATEEQTSTNS